MPTEYVVTGASGFIAGALVRKMRSQDMNVMGVSRHDLGAGSVRVEDYSQTPVARVLIHLAETADRAAVERGGVDAEQRAIQQFSLLLEKPFEHVVYVSSAALYGDSCAAPHGVESPLHVVDTYTRIKCRCESLALERGGSVARLSNVYGPGMHSTSVVAGIIAQLGQLAPLLIGSGRPVRDFLWLDDAASGLTALGHRRAAGKYNFGTGVGTSIRALAEAALRIAGEAMRPIIERSTPDRDSSLLLDYSTSTRDLGWTPGVPLQSGLRMLLPNSEFRENK